MRVIIAARLSRARRGGQEGGGIQSQDQRVREWCERTIDPNTGKPHEVIAVVADTSSGTVPPWKRKNLRPWVTKAELMDQYDGIVAYKNDRLSRGAWEDEVQIRQWAMANKKRLIISDGGPWWPPREDSADQLTWEVMAIQARKEWEDILERTGRARARRDAADSFSGKQSFGYDIVGRHPGLSDYEDKTLVPNHWGLDYIPEMFERCADGWGFRKICNWLTAEGVPTAGGADGWGYNTVRTILQNTIYIGELRHTTGEQKGTLIRRYEPIIDEDLFYRAQAAMEKRRNHVRGPVNDEKPAMLSGVLYCMLCGAKMHRTGSGKRRANGALNQYYRCKCSRAAVWKITEQKSEYCPNSIRVDALDRVVSALMEQKTGYIKIKPAGSRDDLMDKLMEVRGELSVLGRGLSREQKRAREDELWAKEDLLTAALAERDKNGPEPPTYSNETYNGKWAELSTDKERNMWLRETDSKIYACPGYTDDDEARLRKAVGKPGCPIPYGQPLPDTINDVYILTDLMPSALEAEEEATEEVMEEELARLAAMGRSEWNVSSPALVAA